MLAAQAQTDTPLAPRVTAGVTELLGAAAATPALIDGLCVYLDLLNHWNKAYNLVSPRSLETAVSRHLLDSLSLVPFVGATRGTVLDFGTGAGLPGLPLALADPSRAFELLDRSPKKTRFVRQAVMELQLTNVTVHTAQAEAFAGGPFGAITARAVAGIESILASVAHLLAPAGQLLLLRGGHAPDEAASVAAPWRAAVHAQTGPLADSTGHIVVLERA